MGHEIGFPLGVAPSQGTSEPHLAAFLASQGFNVLTYKTVRSRAWKAHPDPLWIFLDDLSEPVQPDAELHSLRAHGSKWSVPPDPYSYSTANSYGVPSKAPEEWQADYAHAKSALADGQVLIASVQGSPEICRTPEALAKDFVVAALKAEEVEADAIELNLSCPNTLEETSAEKTLPPICWDRRATGLIVTRVREALRQSTKLGAKLSYMRSFELDPLLRVIGPHLDAISGVNTLQALVCDPEGKPVFVGTHEDPERPREQAGVSGVALRALARDFVATAASARLRHRQAFDVIGVGGVMVPQDVQALLRLGADAVQTATAAARNPDLAIETMDQARQASLEQSDDR